MEGNGVGAAVRLTQLRRRIERWRGTRVKRSPMPPELWSGATELARELGSLGSRGNSGWGTRP